MLENQSNFNLFDQYPDPEIIGINWPSAYSRCECGRGKKLKEELCGKCELKLIKKELFENSKERKKIIDSNASPTFKDFLLRNNDNERECIEACFNSRVEREIAWNKKQSELILQEIRISYPELFEELRLMKEQIEEGLSKEKRGNEILYSRQKNLPA